MSKGGSTTTTTQNLADEWARNQGIRNYNDVNNLAQQPYTGYRGPGVAGFTQDWRTGADQMRAATLAAGQRVNDAAGVVGGIMGAQTPSFLSGNIGAYMNPYEQQVIDAGMNDLNRARQMQLQADGAQATQAGAFGGDRHGLVEAETNRGFADAAGQMAANLRQQGYVNAQGMMQGDMNREMYQRQLALQGAGQIGALNNAGFGAADAQMGLGREQQALQQARNDWEYAQWQDRQQHPWEMLAARQSALGMVPQNSTQVTTEETQGSFLGGLTGLAGIAGSFIPGIGPAVNTISGLLGGGGASAPAALPGQPNRLDAGYQFGSGYRGSGGYFNGYGS